MRSSPEELVKLGNLTDSVWLSIVPLSSKNNENGDLFKKDGQSMGRYYLYIHQGHRALLMIRRHLITS